jgi:RNA polymerase sigma-70 factor (ECF subfamily)
VELGGNLTQEQFADCINRIKQNDKSGLKEIYDEYLGMIYSIIYGVVNQRENAEDITQDFFVKLYKMAPTMDLKDSHKTFLSVIARNMAIDFIRKDSRNISVDDFVEEGIEPVEKETVEETVVGDMTVTEALATLSENERQVVSMKVLSDMTFKEISETLGVPMGTITWRYQEAIKKLRRLGYE